MSDDYIGGTDMKNRILGILMALTVVCFSGCGLNDLYEQATLPDKIATEQATTIMNCFKTGETVELKNAFCKAVADTHNLDEEINEAIQFIDGNIISDGEWHFFEESASSWRDGVQTESQVSPRIVNILTDTGKTYEIYFHAYIICNHNNNYIGITKIDIYEDDGTKSFEDIPKIRIGEFVE